jgi:hypothetical protein
VPHPRQPLDYPKNEEVNEKTPAKRANWCQMTAALSIERSRSSADRWCSHHDQHRADYPESTRRFNGDRFVTTEALASRLIG